jgi:ankyrin repeat protein
MSRGALLVHEGRSFSTLHSAVREVGASKEVIAFLLEQGLELDAKTDRGETPLHWATKHSSEDVVEYLLLLGADPNLRSNDGLAPLHMTVSSGSHVLTRTKTLNARTLKIIQLLADKTDDEAKHYALWVVTSKFFQTSESEARQSFYRAFISAGADPLTIFADGRTLLFAGCRAFMDDRTHVEFLLSLGVSTKVVDAHGNSVLHHLASAFRRTKIMESERRKFRVILETLIAAGADLRVVNFNSEVAGDALRAIGFDFPDIQH